MGCNFLDRWNENSESAQYQNPNPDPENFEILEEEKFGKWLLCLVEYPNCSTQNGLKLLLFETINSSMRNKSELDPHFLDWNTELVARFRPTERGYQLARTIMESNV